MAQSNLDLGFFQDTKVTYEIHTRKSAGYRVFTADAPTRNCGGGGVDVFYRDAPHFQVKALQLHGPNVMSFQVA